MPLCAGYTAARDVTEQRSILGIIWHLALRIGMWGGCHFPVLLTQLFGITGLSDAVWLPYQRDWDDLLHPRSGLGRGSTHRLVVGRIWVIIFSRCHSELVGVDSRHWIFGSIYGFR